MPRVARVVVPNIPHHVTQRGNRNQRVFFSDQDRRLYLSLLRTFVQVHGVEIWAYCLMDNHVHFVAVPATSKSLSRCFQEVHQVYTRSIHLREGWRGYLWQGRFSSFPMDEKYLVAAMRYVENNPVRANMVQRAQDYAWSSAKSHVQCTHDKILSPCYLVDQIEDWAAFLMENDEERQNNLVSSIKSGRPAGSDEFIGQLEKDFGRMLKAQRPGRKPKNSLAEYGQKQLFVA